MFETERVEIRFADLRVGFRHHEGDDFFTPVGVRPTDNRAFEHAVMAQQDFLYLAGIDIRSAGDDHVLGPVFQRQEAVFIQRAHVAGMEPAAAKRC